MLRLGRWEGTVQTTTEGSWQRITQGRETSRFDHLHTDEQLTVRNSGASLLDARLLTFSLGATFGLTHDWLTTDATDTYDQGILYGYDAFASLLAEQPLSLNVFATRNQSTVSRELAGVSDVTTESHGATLSLSRIYVPSTFTFRQERDDEETRVANISSRRAERRTVFRYEGNRGWVDQDLEATYEFTDGVDEVVPGLSFQEHDGQLNYGLDFGEELNRHFNSRLHVTSRTGLTEATVITADETLRIDHTDHLRSDYRHFFLGIDTPGGTTAVHDLSGSVRYRLWESLVTSAGIGGSHQTLVNGDRDSGRGSLELRYTKRLPRSGVLNVSLGGTLRYDDERFASGETKVLQESHSVATPIALPIALANPFVVAASIVVTKTAVGPLPPGCIPPPGPPTPLVPGQDYTLTTSGDVTEVVPVPCLGATPGINPGDTIVVDYRFAVAPALTFLTKTWHAEASVDYHWVRVFVDHDQSTQDLLAGGDSRFLNDQESTGAGAELRYDGGWAHASVSGEARRFTSTRVSYDTLRAGVHADVSPLRDLVLTLDADQTSTTFRGQHRETLSRSARAGLTYVLGSGVLVTATGGVRSLRDTAQPEDLTAEARLALRWRFRKIELAPEFDWIERERGGTRVTEYRVGLRMTRRF